MTEGKARKRAIRTRMAKTGERYTAARANIVKKPSYDASLLPVSEEAMRRGSGKGWDEWIAALDKWGAKNRTHTEIARHVNQEFGVPGWYAQSITVGYERVRGMRQMNESADGISVNVSKTFSVAAETLFDAIATARGRNRWLDKGTLKTRTTNPMRSARFDFHDGTSRVFASVDAKGPEKTTLTIQHVRLADRKEVEEKRAFWKERLTVLAERLKR